MDPNMIALFRKRAGVTEAVPPLNPQPVAPGPERKKRKLTKAADREVVTLSSAIPLTSVPASRPPKPPSAASGQDSVTHPQQKEQETEQREKEKEREREKGKGVTGSGTRSATPTSQVTRVASGVHPGPITGVSIASLVAGKRPCQSEQEAFEVYSPLVPQSDYEQYAKLPGVELARKICFADAQVYH